MNGMTGRAPPPQVPRPAMPRYMMVLFPAFLLLARAGRRPWPDRLLTAIFGIGLGLYVTLWATWFWVA